MSCAAISPPTPQVRAASWIITQRPVFSTEALVEVPVPHAGVIAKCFVKADETVATGAPLVGFETVADSQDEDTISNSNTVVGQIKSTDQVLHQTAVSSAHTHIATPSARALARRSGVHLSDIHTEHPPIRTHDIQRHLETLCTTNTHTQGMQPLTPQRKAMAMAMTTSHHNVALTTLCDEANITQWSGYSSMTLRIIRAMAKGSQAEPILNSHFDAPSLSYKSFDHMHLAIAIDTSQGLFAPVIKHADRLDQTALKAAIETFKSQAASHTIAADDLHGATLTLSNFGTIAGQFATPMITPPQVAILAVGKSNHKIALQSGEIITQKILPLSLSFDHRLVTGGEAARFLKAILDDLALAE